MVTVRLPNMPQGKEFEEGVSSLFQSAGYYIERNIIERDVEEVLELDIITTDYNISPPEIKLLEVKSGYWGFPDIFKVSGWMNYLKMDRGVLIVNTSKSNVDFIKEKAKVLNIDLRIISPDLQDAQSALTGLIHRDIDQLFKIDNLNWRFSYWVERNLLKRLNHKRKTQQDQKRFRVLEDYYFEVNSGIFFTELVTQKVDRLYSTFKKYPRISAKCGYEMIGQSFDDEYEGIPKELYADTYYKCSFNDIQISTFIEHRARLAILKSAIDYRLYKEAGDKRKTEWLLKISGLEGEFDLMATLPGSFLDGLERIAAHKYYHLYPIFWQWFVFIFGGLF